MYFMKSSLTPHSHPFPAFLADGGRRRSRQTVKTQPHNSQIKKTSYVWLMARGTVKSNLHTVHIYGTHQMLC